VSDRPVFRSGREDGRFVSTAGFVHAFLKHMQPKLAFDPAMKREEFAGWQDAVREELRELMLLPQPPDQPAPKQLWTEARDGYRLEKWEAYPEPFSVVPYLMLIPDGVDDGASAPAVLCFPGSASSKESRAGEPELPDMPPPRPHWEENRMALFYVQRGMVVVAVDNPGTRETGSSIRPERHEISQYSIWAGRHYEGISVFHKLCILDWLKTRPYVDTERIATCGHSLGAKPALVLSVLDPSIRATVWNDFVSLWRERAVAENLLRIAIHQYVPGILAWFDYPDLLASLAPRPLLITEGGRTRDIERIREAYRLVGAEDQITVTYYPKYATPDKRPYDDADLPEGLSMEEYFLYANVDAPEHSFKGKVAVPWLADVLGSGAS